MIKQLLIIGIFINAFSAFSQNLKKENKLLSARITASIKEYDSLRELEQTEQRQSFDFGTALQQSSAYKTIDSSSRILSKFEEQRFQYEKLTDSKINASQRNFISYYTNKIQVETKHLYAYENYPDLYADRKSYVLNEKHSTSKAEQNEYLRLLEDSLIHEIEQIKISLLGYEEIKVKSQQMQKLFEKYAPEFEQTLAEINAIQIDKKLDSLEHNFKQKGPNGFKEEYFMTFEDAFPDQTKKIRDERNKYQSFDMEPAMSPAPPPAEIKQVEIYEFVDEEAEFPGGRAALMKYLQNSLFVHVSALKKNKKGKCYVKFVITNEGKIEDVRVLRGVPNCPTCDAEAVRVVKSMPLWKPARINGQAVSCYYNLPIDFSVQ